MFHDVKVTTENEEGGLRTRITGDGFHVTHSVTHRSPDGGGITTAMFHSPFDDEGRSADAHILSVDADKLCVTLTYWRGDRYVSLDIFQSSELWKSLAEGILHHLKEKPEDRTIDEIVEAGRRGDDLGLKKTTVAIVEGMEGSAGAPQPQEES